MEGLEPVKRLWQKRSRQWVDLEDDLAIIVDNSTKWLRVLKSAGIRKPRWLAALALYLAEKDMDVLVGLLSRQQYRRKYYMQLCVTVMLHNQPMLTQKAALDWLFERREDDTDMDFPTQFWEFSAMYHYYHTRRIQNQRETTDLVVKTVHLGAYTVAILLRGTAESLVFLADVCGDVMISCLDTKPKFDGRTRVVCKTYVQHTRLLTDWVRASVQWTMVLKDQSHWVEQGPLAEFMLLQYAVAGMGAISIVGDAALESTTRILSASIRNTAAVLDHLYDLPPQILIDAQLVCQNIYLSHPGLSLWSIAKTTSKRSLEMSRRKLRRSQLMIDKHQDDDCNISAGAQVSSL